MSSFPHSLAYLSVVFFFFSLIFSNYTRRHTFNSIQFFSFFFYIALKIHWIFISPHCFPSNWIIFHCSHIFFSFLLNYNLYFFFLCCDWFHFITVNFCLCGRNCSCHHSNRRMEFHVKAFNHLNLNAAHGENCCEKEVCDKWKCSNSSSLLAARRETPPVRHVSSRTDKLYHFIVNNEIVCV